MARRAVLFWLMIGLTMVSGCGQPSVTRSEFAATSPPWFADVTADLDLQFVHDPGPVDGAYFMPQINGSGAALFDFNNDGRLDIYLLQCAGPGSKAKNALFEQLPSGKFSNVSEDSGLDFDGHNFGVAAGDVNNDGLVDVVVTQYLGVRLLLNQGEGKFVDSTESAALANPHWGASTSFVDYDRDGWLDLVIVNYLDFEETRYCAGRGGKRDYCLPNMFQGTPTRLHRNRGVDAQGQWLGYEDRTAAAGLEEKPGPGMGVVCADFSGDGWPDIFVTNDLAANQLWINQHNGVFVEEAAPRGVAYNAFGAAESNMGAAYGDVDGDGLLDLFVTHFTNENHGLWKQGPAGSFQERSIAAGLSRCRWHGTGWGAVLADFDHSGSLDIALLNGFVQRRDAPSEKFWNDYLDRNQVFANDGSGRFEDISSSNPALCDVPNVGRALCSGDIDGDGALDLLVTQIGGPARILKNVAPQRGHWLMVRALDEQLHRDAIGAEIRVQSGERVWRSVLQPAQSYQCSHDPRVHVGLGDAAQVDFIGVRWPDGRAERFPCLAVDRVIELVRGKGEPEKGDAAGKP
jgi:enediyne biosynthesis protein E4